MTLLIVCYDSLLNDFELDVSGITMRLILSGRSRVSVTTLAIITCFVFFIKYIIISVHFIINTKRRFNTLWGLNKEMLLGNSVMT